MCVLVVVMVVIVSWMTSSASSGQIGPEAGYLDCLLEVDMGHQSSVSECVGARIVVWGGETGWHRWKKPDCSGTMIGMF